MSNTTHGSESNGIVVAFIDIDGVFNRFTKGYSTPHHVKKFDGKDIILQMEPETVFMFNKLVDKKEYKVVLSSSWRHDPEWRETMRQNGFVFDFLDRTPTKFMGDDGHDVYESWNRGEFIKKWIEVWDEANPENKVVRYAIIDDNDDMLPEQRPHFFKTDTGIGLTQEILDNVERHLDGATD